MKSATASSQTNAIPTPLLGGLLAVMLFMALLALEISAGLVRENRTIANSLFVFPAVLTLFWGLLTRRRWALWFARLAAVLGSLWFCGWAIAAAVIRPTDTYGPVWIWILGVSIVLGSITLASYFALGRVSVKRHYAMHCPHCQSAAAGATAYFSRDLSCQTCGTTWSPSQISSAPRQS